MNLRHHSESRRGTGRSRNEDSVFIDPDCAAFAVADGLGGMPAGDVASRTAVDAVQRTINDQGCEALQDMNAVVEHAHQAVARKGREAVGATIATTLTLAHLNQSCVHVAHVGDSFALLVRKGSGILLTDEHTWERSRRRVFDLAPFSEAFRRSLTQALGADVDLQADIASMSILPGDRLLLATDGISSVLPPPDLIDIVNRGVSPEQTTVALCTTAIARGGTDDVTAITIFVEAVG